MTVQEQKLDNAAVAAVDTAGQLADILAMPDHITDAIWRVDSAAIEPGKASSMVICGMGGSAIGGDFALALAARDLAGPVEVVRDYTLPAWVTAETAVFCSSYSGNTEETLACYEQASERGCPRIVATSGGLLADRAHADGVPVIGLPGILQPRASVAYMTIAVLEGLAAFTISPSRRDELEGAVELLREQGSAWAPDSGSDSAAKSLARRGDGKVTAIYGAGLTSPVAYRWKCQINENAKVPSWSATIPESNHNDINGWGGAAEIAAHAVWFLRDAGQHERTRTRIELNAKVAADAGADVEIIDTIGDTPVQRLLSTVLLGDLTSLYMATLRGIDPSPVPVIEWLKDSLGRPS